jgi:hypothetical protein
MVRDSFHSHRPSATSTASCSYRAWASWWGVAALGCFYWAVGASGPDVNGLYQDDGIYVATAQSLAQGNGYRHIEAPGEPYQTKYPFLYPAVLSLMLRIQPGYPLRPAALLPSALAAAGFVVVSVLYCRRVLGMTRPVAVGVAVLAALSPTILALSRFTLSDLPYACLSMLALVCVDGKYESASTPGRRRAWLVAGAILVAASMLTRAFGVTLAAAVVLMLVARRRWIDAAIAVAVIVACLTPWWVWQYHAARANGPIQTAMLLQGDLSYGLWLPHGVGETARTMVQNVFRTMFGICQFELALPNAIMAGSFSEVSWRMFVAHAVAYLATGLILVGFVASAREKFRTVHVYALCYGALMLAWPFQPFRFLTVWAPLLIYVLLRGCAAVAGAVGRRRHADTATVWVVTACLVVCFVLDDAQLVASPPDRVYLMRKSAPTFAADAEATAFIRSHTNPRDVIVSSEPARLFLRTGRRGVRLWHDNDPYALYNGKERRWSEFYIRGDTAAVQYAQVRAELPHAYRQMGVRYVLLARQGMSPVLARYVIEEHPELFHLYWGSASDAHCMYRFEYGGE